MRLVCGIWKEGAESMEKRNTNQTYGETLVRLGETRKNLVVVEADLMKASGSAAFVKAYPNRQYNVGIAEQNLIGFSAGLAATGKIPFASTFACFAAQRACDQAVNAVAYNNFNVKIIGTSAGLTSEKNGGTHISVADLAIYRAIPRFQVFDPGDAEEFAQVLEYAADYVGPVYIRSNKGDFPVFHSPDYQFKPGVAEVLQDGADVGLITTGITTNEGIQACQELNRKGIEVYHLHMGTIKPFDEQAVLDCVSKVKKIVTVENHSIIGGLGSAVAEVLAKHGTQAKLVQLGLRDCFGETATLDYMMHKHGIDASGIIETITQL